MKEKHYKNELSRFFNQEMSKEERQAVAEHLLLCDSCRREHDAIKFGAALAGSLAQTDAPDAVWNRIAAELDGKPAPRLSLIPQQAFFSLRNVTAFATAILMVSALSFAVYYGLISDGVSQIAQGPPAQNVNTLAPGSGQPDQPPVNGGNTATPNNSNTGPAPEMPTGPGSFWQFETIAGMPKVGGESGQGKLAVGDFLETDAGSRARIEVADIGNVEIAPNSRVTLVGTDPKEHRLSLERGQLHAKIFAPPRLFIVDTPSAVAVDLGCEYTLDVDKQGNSKLHVTGGFVALELNGRESIVPAGAMCLTKKGKGLGTPFSVESTAAFQAALTRFDFANGGKTSLQTIINEADFYDMFTLWHLLSRVPANDRGVVYDALADFVAPPAGVTRDGIIALDKKMLDLWRTEVENAWFE